MDENNYYTDSVIIYATIFIVENSSAFTFFQRSSQFSCCSLLILGGKYLTRTNFFLSNKRMEIVADTLALIIKRMWFNCRWAREVTFSTQYYSFKQCFMWFFLLECLIKVKTIVLVRQFSLRTFSWHKLQVLWKLRVELYFTSGSNQNKCWNWCNF